MNHDVAESLHDPPGFFKIHPNLKEPPFSLSSMEPIWCRTVNNPNLHNKLTFTSVSVFIQEINRIIFQNFTINVIINL